MTVRRRHRRARVGQRKDHGRNGFDRCAARGRAIASRRSRSARTSSTPATTRWPPAGPAATSTRCWSASDLIGPLYRHGSRGRRHRRGRRRDGPVRRPHRRRRDRSRAAGPPRTSPACSVRRWCSSSTRAARATASPHCCTGFRRSITATRIAGVILNRVGSPRHERGAAAGLRAGGCPGARRAFRASTNWLFRQGIWAWSPRSSTVGTRAPRSTR